MKPFWQFCWFLIKRFEANENRRAAAELTFVTLFAIVPLMASGYVMLTWFPQYANFIDNFHEFIFKHFIPASGDAIQNYLSDFSHQAKNLTWIGLIILLFSAISLMMSIENAFNQIWRVKTLRVGRRLLFYWLVLIFGPLLMGTAFLVSSYLMSTTIWVDHVDVVFNSTVKLFKILPFILAAITLTAMYYFLPSCKVNIKHAALGGVFAALVLELFKKVFVEMVSLSPSYQLIYGAFAVVPLFLIWIFLTWCVVLFGAELARAMPFIYKNTKGVQASELDWALMIMQQLKHSNEQTRVTREDLCQALTLVNVDEWEAVLVTLIDEQWITNQMDELYLNVKLDEKTVGDLSELIHNERMEKFTVIDEHSMWFNTLKPLLADLRIQKKAALGLPILDLI